MAAPILVALLVGGSLFTGGVAVKDKDPVLGSVLIGAGVGTAIGGGIGTVGGVAGALGTTTTAATVGTAAAIGGVAGSVVGAAAAPSYQNSR